MLASGLGVERIGWKWHGLGLQFFSKIGVQANQGRVVCFLSIPYRDHEEYRYKGMISEKYRIGKIKEYAKFHCEYLSWRYYDESDKHFMKTDDNWQYSKQ